jgi:hypothetical protein
MNKMSKRRDIASQAPAEGIRLTREPRTMPDLVNCTRRTGVPVWQQTVVVTFEKFCYYGDSCVAYST